MKYYKSFNLFEAATENSWSVKNSATGHLFSKVFSGFGFSMKSRKLKGIAKEYDEYLKVVFDTYMKERKVIIPIGKPIEEVQPAPQIQENPVDAPEDNIDNTPNPEQEKDNKDFSDLGLDVQELEGLLQSSKTPEEVQKYLNELKQLAIVTQKEIDDLMIKVENGEDVSKLYDKKKEKLDRINAILKKVKPKSAAEAYFESVDWTANAIHAPEIWTEEDKKTITAKVNPYKIEEFSLRKRSIIETEDDQKKVKKLENEWALLINDIHKRWFYIFEITKLDDKYKSTTKKDSPAAIKSAKTLEVLKTSFNEKSQIVYSLNQISANKGYYVLSNFNNDLILLYKLSGSEKIFKVIGNMDISENKSQIDWLDSDKSVFVWNVNTNKYRDFNKDTIITSYEVKGVKYKLKMTTSLGKDYPCIEFVSENGYMGIESFYKEGDLIKNSKVSVRDVPFTLYSVKETQHIDVKEPSAEINSELKKTI